ncbi:AbpR response regulator [Lactobacillus equicursoris 66c]|uniref:AbpR response regulator n=1 Tax=Lactobacillus equicursoris 66c TaxID=872326 RepID=K0NMZ0_9LACO|nr:LytTR family DNA-binding domain-containing protein [Lactobacillus equicursoris]CCK83039.1 AbpR response regulator [Lactobacillus equicursoris 66c]
MKYQIFICDDNQETIDQLTSILQIASFRLSDDDSITFSIVGQATTFESAIAILQKSNPTGGIYFLDVELGKNVGKDNGFDLAEYIKQMDSKAQIIFVTSHADLSIITYQRRLGPIDYIVKSSNIADLTTRISDTLKSAINTLKKANSENEMFFTYKVGHEIRRIAVSDIYYISTTGNSHKLELVHANGISQFIGSISKVADKAPYLLQISQSCLINPNKAEVDYQQHRITFPNGDIQYYSRKNSHMIRDYFKK